MLSLDRGTGLESIILTALVSLSIRDLYCIGDVCLLLDQWTGIERIIDLELTFE